MSLPLRRTCAFLAPSLALVFALLPAPAQAVMLATPPIASAQQVTAVPQAPTVITLVADDDVEANHQFAIASPPAHGTLELAAENHCTYPDAGGTHCTIVATYTSAAGYAGPDSFTYTAAQGSLTSLPATVSIQVVAPTPPAPVLPAAPTVSGSATASAGSDWVGTAGGLLAGATVDYGDLSGAVDLAPGSTGTSLLRHTFGAARSYTVTVTNHGSTGSSSATTMVAVLAVTPTTPSTLSLPPNAVGSIQAPGLYVQVISGSILIHASASATFAAGQFGFTPSFTQPPIIMPVNPGIRFTPPPAFAPAKVLSSTQLTIQGADAKSSATVDVAYAKKMYCNSRATARASNPVDCIVRSLHSSAAAEGPTPELWFIAADGTLQPVGSSSASGARSGVNAKAGVITMTLDATSTPTLASLAKTTSFAALVRRQARAGDALRRTGAARAVRWPARTTISTGVAFTCPKVSTRGCTVRLRAVSRQLGVSRVVGARMMHVGAGATAPLDFTLARPGRWRLANDGLVAALSVDAVAYQPTATREHRGFALRVKLPR